MTGVDGGIDSVTVTTTRWQGFRRETVPSHHERYGVITPSNPLMPMASGYCLVRTPRPASPSRNGIVLSTLHSAGARLRRPERNYDGTYRDVYTCTRRPTGRALAAGAAAPAAAADIGVGIKSMLVVYEHIDPFRRWLRILHTAPGRAGVFALLLCPNSTTEGGGDGRTPRCVYSC